MLIVDNEGQTDPRLNLALEEYLLRHVLRERPLFLFYRNEPSVILGRNQNLFEEVNRAYARAHGIVIVRRLSGGGAVYHDLGNLNYSIFLPDQSRLHDFAYCTSFLSRPLATLGVAAELRQRSSLFVGVRKISGNAQYASRGKLLHHGTLLFDTDLEALQEALQPEGLAIDSRAVQSVRSRVANLRELLPTGSTLDGLREAILEGLRRAGDTDVLRLTAADWDAVRALAQERYQSWAWNVGRSPRFTLHRETTLAGGMLAVETTIDRGYIDALAIRQVGLEPLAADLDALADRLTGASYAPDGLRTAVRAALSQLGAPVPLDEEALLDLLGG